MNIIKIPQYDYKTPHNVIRLLNNKKFMETFKLESAQPSIQTKLNREVNRIQNISDIKSLPALEVYYSHLYASINENFEGSVRTYLIAKLRDYVNANRKYLTVTKRRQPYKQRLHDLFQDKLVLISMKYYSEVVCGYYKSMDDTHIHYVDYGSGKEKSAPLVEVRDIRSKDTDLISNVNLGDRVVITWHNGNILKGTLESLFSYTKVKIKIDSRNSVTVNVRDTKSIERVSDE